MPVLQTAEIRRRQTGKATVLSVVCRTGFQPVSRPASRIHADGQGCPSYKRQKYDDGRRAKRPSSPSFVGRASSPSVGLLREYMLTGRDARPTNGRNTTTADGQSDRPLRRL